LEAAKPVNGFFGDLLLGRKLPPTVQTENELHILAVVPNELTLEVSKLSQPLGSCLHEVLVDVDVRTIYKLTFSPMVKLRIVAASNKEVAFSRY
jgi:hypothetical protein